MTKEQRGGAVIGWCGVGLVVAAIAHNETWPYLVLGAAGWLMCLIGILLAKGEDE